MCKTDWQSLNQLKNIFKEKWDIDLIVNEDIFSRIDAWFDWNDKRYQIEVKRRRFNKDKYPTALLNKDKYEELIKRKAFLVCMYDDKWGILKDVEKAFINEKIYYCKHCTDFPSDYEYSNKIELNLDEFTWYDY